MYSHVTAGEIKIITAVSHLPFAKSGAADQLCTWMVFTSSADPVTSVGLPTHVDSGTSLTNRCLGWCRGTPKAVSNRGADVLQKEHAVLLLFPWGDVLGPSQSSQDDMNYQLGAYSFKETDLASSGVPHLLPWRFPGRRAHLALGDRFSDRLALTAQPKRKPFIQPQVIGGKCLGFLLVPTLNHCHHRVALQCERHIRERKFDCQIQWVCLRKICSAVAFDLLKLL